MQFVEFPQVNKRLGPPKGMSAAQCGTLPVYADGRSCISCWVLSPEEIEHLVLNGGRIWLGIMSGETQPPVFVSATEPDMPPLTERHHPLPAGYAETVLTQFSSRLPDPAFAHCRPQLGSELIRLNPELRQPNGRRLDLGTRYFIMSNQIQAQHLAALIDAYERAGTDGVVAYLRPYEYFLHDANSQPAQ